MPDFGSVGWAVPTGCDWAAWINLLRKTGVYNRSYFALLPNLLRSYYKNHLTNQRIDYLTRSILVSVQRFRVQRSELLFLPYLRVVELKTCHPYYFGPDGGMFASLPQAGVR
jgi:hypothetical protein